MKLLIVYWEEQAVGTLAAEKNGEMIFQYSADWLKQNKFPISINLPLQAEPFDAPKTKFFFENLLPESYVRQAIAEKIGISSANNFGLLNAIGGECAGALSLQPSTTTELPDGKLIKLDDNDLDAMLGQMSQQPLIFSHREVRLSLAGAQEKIPVFIDDNALFLPTGKFSSSHILKPQIPRFPGTVENECFCMMLALDAGLGAAHVHIYQTPRTRCLLIKRYDRELVIGSKKLKRIHQEDFCQALGFPSHQKYQNEGGPKIKDCFGLVANKSSHKILDQVRLIKWLAFNYIIGNHDAHAKNISLLFDDNLIKLAPFYDLMSTEVYPALSQKFAMKIGGYYERNHIYSRHWEAMASEIGIPWKFVRENLLLCATDIEKVLVKTKRKFDEMYTPAKTVDEISLIAGRNLSEIISRLK